MPKEEWFKIFFGYLIPFVLAGVLGLLGKFAGFLVFEFLDTKRVGFLLILFIVSFYISPYGAGWLTLCGFFLLVGYSLLNFLVGPQKGDNHIFFTGFYDNSGEKGFFSRNGSVRFLDAQFLKVFQDLVQNSVANELVGMSVIDFRVPSLIYSWCDFDRFRKLTGRYAKRGLGVVWGTTDKGGNLQHLESHLHTDIYVGKQRAQEHIDAVVQVLKNSVFSTEEKTSFLAQTLAAFWISSCTNFLTEKHSWKAGLDVNKQARRLIEKALATLENQTSIDPTKVLAYARRMILPNFSVEEARTRYHAKHWEEAIDLLVQTLLLNPYYPFDSASEFQSYYLAQHHASVTVDAPLKDEIIGAELALLEQEITPASPPHLQLLINWFRGCGKELKDIDTKIESSFSTLQKSFPDNPFVYLFWSDAIKIPSRLGIGKKEKAAASMTGKGLPIRVLEAAVEKCERAYELAPEMNVTASRIVGLTFVLALSYDERTIQHKKWMKKFKNYSEKALVHVDDMSSSWAKNGKDIYDWKKYGLEMDDENGLSEVSEDSEEKS